MTIKSCSSHFRQVIQHQVKSMSDDSAKPQIMYEYTAATIIDSLVKCHKNSFTTILIISSVRGGLTWEPEGCRLMSSSDWSIWSVDWYLERCQLTSWAIPRCLRATRRTPNCSGRHPKRQPFRSDSSPYINACVCVLFVHVCIWDPCV